jgi:hypothetical protein
MKSDWVSGQVESGHKFDLRNLSEGTEGSRKLSRLLWGAFFLGTVGIIAISSIAAALGTVLVERAFEVDLIGLVFGAMFFLIYVAQGPSPVASQLDDSSLRFTLPNGTILSRRWDDPRFELKVKEWSSSHRAGGDFDFVHEIMGRPNPTIPITPELFAAIMNETRKHGLDVTIKQSSGPFRTGFMQYTIRAARRA